MQLGDKVKSNLSLWKDDLGTVIGIIPIWSLTEEDEKIGEHVHVLFPETDKHEAYQQSFNSSSLIIVKN